jgi:hypothetical protein
MWFPFAWCWLGWIVSSTRCDCFCQLWHVQSRPFRSDPSHPLRSTLLQLALYSSFSGPPVHGTGSQEYAMRKLDWPFARGGLPPVDFLAVFLPDFLRAGSAPAFNDALPPPPVGFDTVIAIYWNRIDACLEYWLFGKTNWETRRMVLVDSGRRVIRSIGFTVFVRQQGTIHVCWGRCWAG